MDTFVVTSMRPSAGKTSIIIGITKALNRKIGYIKPFGERFLYRKKRMWDYDAALITNIFGLDENPEDMSIGFHHAKLLFMLDEATTGEKLRELQAERRKRKGAVLCRMRKRHLLWRLRPSRRHFHRQATGCPADRGGKRR